MATVEQPFKRGDVVTSKWGGLGVVHNRYGELVQVSWVIFPNGDLQQHTYRVDHPEFDIQTRNEYFEKIGHIDDIQEG